MTYLLDDCCFPNHLMRAFIPDFVMQLTNKNTLFELMSGIPPSVDDVRCMSPACRSVLTATPIVYNPEETKQSNKSKQMHMFKHT